MNTKAQVLENVLKAVLILALFFVLWTLLTRYSGDFVKATSDCQAGFTCIPTSDCHVGTIAGYDKDLVGKCKLESYVCCTSPEIKVALANRRLPVNDRSFVVTVSNVEGEYPVGREIPLFVGSPYDITIRKFDTPIDDEFCDVKIVNENNRIVSVNYAGQSEAEPASATASCRVVGDNLVMYDEFLEDVIFSNNHRGTNLKLQVLVHEKTEAGGKGEKIMEANFPLDILLPFRIIEPREQWKQEHKITVRCMQGGCRGISLEPASRIGAIEEYCSDAIIGEDKEFEDKEAEFLINRESFDRNHLDRFYDNELNNTLCFEGTMGNGEKIIFRTKNKIMIDIEAPRIEDIDNLFLKCADNSGTCDETYYQIVAEKYSQSDLRSSNFDTKEELEESLKDAAIDVFMGIIAGWGNDVLGVSDCPDPGAGYKRATNGKIEPRHIVFGEVCVYGVDEAGNEGTPSKRSFWDKGEITKELGSEVADELDDRWDSGGITDVLTNPPPSIPRQFR